MIDDNKVQELIERLRKREDHRYILAVHPPRPAKDRDCNEAADMLEAFLAFRQEVSDAVEKHKAGMYLQDTALDRFIIAKPDPLVEIADEMKETYCPTNVAWARNIHQALAKRNLKIVEDK